MNFRVSGERLTINFEECVWGGLSPRMLLRASVYRPDHAHSSAAFVAGQVVDESTDDGGDEGIAR